MDIFFRDKARTFLLGAAIFSGSMHASTPAVSMDQKRLIEIEQMQQQAAANLSELGQQLRSQLEAVKNTIHAIIIPLINNPKLTKCTQETREEMELWARSLGSQIDRIEKTLRTRSIPTKAQLENTGCALMLYVDALIRAVEHKFEADFRTTIGAQNVVEFKKELRAQIEKGNAAKIQELMQSVPEQERAAFTAELITAPCIQHTIQAVTELQLELARLTSQYGVSYVNKIARKLDVKLKKIQFNAITPVIKIAALLAATKIASGYILPSDSTAMDKLKSDVLVGATTMAIQHFGGRAFSAWSGYLENNLSKIGKQIGAYWNRVKGVKDAEAPGEFRMLKLDECEGPEEMVIGLEDQFEMITSSIRSTLIRRMRGEPEPFNGVQHLWLLLGKPGSGKTYLAKQIQRQLAKLQEELGYQLAYEEINVYDLLLGDILARIQEAQRRNVGLILWVDEVHLAKPHKDGNAPLLYQLLKAEVVNKSNTPIWIFAASNEPGRFDAALTRSGRFEVVHIYEPSFQNRYQLFEYYLGQRGLVLPKETLNRFAAQTHGQSPATIRKVIDSAHASGDFLTQETVHEAICRTVFHLVPGFVSALNNTERRLITAYQAGQGLMHMLMELKVDPQARAAFEKGTKFVFLTAGAVEQPIKELAGMIVDAVAVNINMENPRRVFGKLFSYNGQDELNTQMTVGDKERAIYELLAGACAQELLLKDVSDTMRKADCKKASDYCRDIMCAGRPFDFMSKKEQESCKERANALYNKILDEVRQLLLEHQQACEAIMNQMLKNQKAPHVTDVEIIDLIQKYQQKSTPLPIASPLPAA